MGKFIAIEGLDGSGKSTQINMLIEHFKSKGVQTKFVHFPRSNEGVFGNLIAKFLRGEFGDVKDVHPQLVALLFAQDRKDFSDTIQNWIKNDYMVLVDRYVLSNIAFQCAKVKGHKEKEVLSAWINMFEYEYNNILRPDLSIYLDVPFEFTNSALNKRRDGAERSYLNGKDDIHEKDMGLQAAVKAEYEKLAKTDSSITTITCYDNNNNMKPAIEIHELLLKAIHERL